MKDYIANRVYEISAHILDTGDTVRGAAKVFGVSKSTVHKDVTERLQSLSTSLFEEVSAVLAGNLSERHIRGGIATKIKYQKTTEEK